MVILNRLLCYVLSVKVQKLLRTTFTEGRQWRSAVVSPALQICQKKLKERLRDPTL